jgi:hypothetical protein
MRLDPVGEYVLNHMVPPLASSPAPAGLDPRLLAEAWSETFAHIEPDDFRIKQLVGAYARAASRPAEEEQS